LQPRQRQRRLPRWPLAGHRPGPPAAAAVRRRPAGPGCTGGPATAAAAGGARADCAYGGGCGAWPLRTGAPAALIGFILADPLLRRSVMPARQPSLFLPHGAGPCFFMDWQPAHTWQRMGDFLRGVAASLPERPSAILLISGHWLEPDFRVTGAAQPELIYDYYDFPPHTYEIQYP